MQLEDVYTAFDAAATQETLDGFLQITRRYTRFHIAFCILTLLQLAALLLFFSTLVQSTLFAFIIASLLFTAFSYFVLLFYFQTKKPQQLLSLKETLRAQYAPEAHEALRATLHTLLAQLHRMEYRYYTAPASLPTLSLLVQKFSVWTHWKDVHQMKEILLFALLRLEIDAVKRQPLDLNAHALLAAAYRSLAALYTDPRQLEPEEEHLFVSAEYAGPSMGDKFRQAATRSVEECKIIDAYAPGNPWVQLQLATLYRALGQTKEEIGAYEALLKSSPENTEVMLQLGVLYFQQGQSAQALQLYAQLRECDLEQAEMLITHYDAAVLEG